MGIPAASKAVKEEGGKYFDAQGDPTYKIQFDNAFGLTNGGDPLHPLMLSYDTPLQEWSKL